MDHESIAKDKGSRCRVARWLRGAGVCQTVQEGPEERSGIDRCDWLSQS